MTDEALFLTTSTGTLRRMTSTSFETDIELGATYKDLVTGFEGIAISLEFHLTRCEQVALTASKDGSELKAYYFDVTQVELVTPASDKITAVNQHAKDKPGAAVREQSQPSVRRH